MRVREEVQTPNLHTQKLTWYLPLGPPEESGYVLHHVFCVTRVSCTRLSFRCAVSHDWCYAESYKKISGQSDTSERTIIRAHRRVMHGPADH